MRKCWWAILLGGVFVVSQVATVGDYGMNWDSPFRWLRGQAYWQLLTQGQRRYDQVDRLAPVLIRPGEYAARYDVSAWEEWSTVPTQASGKPHFEFRKLARKGESFYAHEAWNGEYFVRSEGPGHPPLSDIAAAGFNRWLYGKWGIRGDLESYVVWPMLVAGVGVMLVSLWTAQLTGSRAAGVVGGLALGLWPLYFGEAAINFKDPVQAVFFTLALWGVWQRRWWVSLLGLMGAVGVKWNIVFWPMIVGPWWWLVKWPPRRLFMLVGVGLVILVGWLIAIWPYLWAEPIKRLIEMVDYYRQIAWGGAKIQPISNWQLLITQTPEVVLILAGLGVWSIVRGKKRGETLILIWLLVPLVRSSIPGMWLFGGLRQVLEILPAIAILAGIGVNWLWEKFRWKTGYRWASLTMIFSVLLWPIIRLHPNQNMYFNSLTGGLAGAVKRGMVDWTVSYGNLYKQGVEWLNQNAETGARVGLIRGSDYALSPVWLRDDISWGPNYFSGWRQQGEYIFLLYNPLDPTVFAHRYVTWWLKPVHEVKVDGVAMLSIYKNAPETMVRRVTEKSLLPRLSTGVVDLGQEVVVTRVTVDTDRQCARENGPFIDEIIKFDNGVSYGLQEHYKNDQGEVEFWFAGELSRTITIKLQSQESCFAGGKVVKVTYVE